MSRRADRVRQFAGLEVLVVGDAMLDRYLAGPSTRLSPEAAVPVVAVARCDAYAGGAANTAANAAALGARVTLIAPIGDDPAGDRLRERLAEGHVAFEPAGVVAGRRTLTKTRIVAGETPVCRLDEGDTGPPGPEAVEAMVAAIARRWTAADVVILSDYAYGALPVPAREGIAALQREEPRVLAVDSRDLPRYRECRPTLVKPNRAEAYRLLGEASESPGWLATAGSRLREVTGAAIVALTLGAEGAVVVAADGEVVRTAARPVEQSRAAGAGDCYLAAFALALGAGAASRDAAEIAACAAQIATAAEGTAVCTGDALLAALEPVPPGAIGEGDLRRLVEGARAAGQRIVFTNGVFDLLHPGHVRYLAAARALGDLLVVAINSDDSVRRLKGPGRPLNSVDERAAVLAGLASVDAVVVFDEPTPERLIRALRPDVYAKGGDYTRDRLPEAPLVESLGGTVVLLDHDGHSTTRIIERLKATPRRDRRPQRPSRAPLEPHR